MFSTLVPLTKAQVIATADGLHAGNPVAILIDPRPAYMLFLSSASRGLPYEIDLVVVGSDMSEPLGMTAQERDTLMPWANDVVKRVCAVWKARHPPNGPEH